MKFKNGDKVVVVKVEAEYGACLGHTGTIVDVDPDWEYPYEVSLDDKELCEAQELGQMQELFGEYEIEFINVLKEEVQEIINPTYVNIKFQEGAVDEVGINGTQIEDVIDILVTRLQGFQQGDFSCRENVLAITHLQEAQNWLYRRTMERKKQGVEGKSVKHK